MSDAALKSDIHEHVPEWLSGILSKGYRPYIATSERLLPSLNTTPFGLPTDIYLLDEAEQIPFLEAYLLSNSLSFSSPDLKMPHWVVIDCALMQSAIVGFTKPVDALPADLITYYQDDPRVELKRLTQIPVSGQIASPSTEPGNFVGISLFSLGHKVAGDSRVGLYTKALALEVYRAREGERFEGSLSTITMPSRSMDDSPPVWR